MHLKRHPRKHLSAQFVKHISKQGKYFDGYGLFLLVKPNGTKYWVQRITIQGKRRELGLGSVELVSLAEARGKAIDNYKMARAGGSPLKEEMEQVTVPTFEQAAHIVYKMNEKIWTEKHAAQFITTLQNYAFQKIGGMKVTDISSADILSVLEPIWIEKAETARRLKQRIVRTLRWVVVQGYRKDNPAENVDEALPKAEIIKQPRKALPYAQVFHCIETVKKSKAGLTTKLALEFLILTAARSGEVRGALWSEIDFDNALWSIPAARMKMKRDHRVPLVQRALDILHQIKNCGFSKEIIFPSLTSGKALSDVTLSKLIKELGFDVDVHGFRTSFRTWAQDCTDYPREIAEMALAHGVGNAVEQAYARSDLLDKRRQMMRDWADYIAKSS